MPAARHEHEGRQLGRPPLAGRWGWWGGPAGMGMSARRRGPPGVAPRGAISTQGSAPNSFCDDPRVHLDLVTLRDTASDLGIGGMCSRARKRREDHPGRFWLLPVTSRGCVVAASEGARFPAGTLAAVDEACGAEGRAGFILAAVSRALAPDAAGGPLRGGSGRLSGGVPCNGVACSHSGCWQRDTARYGDPLDHGGLILCTAHASDAVGVKYRRPESPLAGQAGRGARN
jgi:hypothetical protein